MSNERRAYKRCPAPEVRASKTNPAVRVIRAYAAVYGAVSQNLGGFVEVIDAGAFDGCLGDDVAALFNHDSDHVLGATWNGTCTLTSDEVGLAYEVVVNENDSQAVDLAARIERGDVRGSSFQFAMPADGSGEVWELSSQGFPQRRLVRVAALFDVGPVTFAAYKATEVDGAQATLALRGLAAATSQPIDLLVAAAGRNELRSLLPPRNGEQKEVLESETRNGSDAPNAAKVHKVGALRLPVPLLRARETGLDIPHLQSSERGAAMSNEHLKRISEQRLRAWEAAKAILDTADAEKRALDATEEAAWQAATAEIDALDKRALSIIDAEERSRNIENALGKLPAAEKPAAKDFESELRSFLRGVNGKEITVMPSVEQRVVTKGATGAPSPTAFYDRLVTHMVQVGPMLDVSTLLDTQSGENLQIPRTTAFSTAAITAENTAISASDPTFGAFITLGAYKYSFLLQISREMVEDEGVDVLGFVAEQTGIAMGVALNAGFTVGTGTSQPRGITIDTTLGVTGGTAVSGAFTADNLIDLLYSVNASYRRMPGCAWMMRDSGIAATRKLKDSQNRYLFEPSLQAGQPDNLLGFPLISNPDIAAPALSAKSVTFGLNNRYFIRRVNGVRLDRSDEFAFSSDLVTFRATCRADGALADTTGAVKHFIGAGT